MPEPEDFPHHGDHLATDTLQAEMTLGLLALFALVAVLVAVVAF